MSGRFKPYLLIILGMLIVGLLLGPPLAFASKLPTVCNIFQKSVDKAGECKQRAMVSKAQDKSFEFDSAHFASLDSAIFSFATAPEDRPSFFQIKADLSQSNPLRC